MSTLTEILTHYGSVGTEALKNDVSKVSATGETEKSIRFEVVVKQFVTSLTYYGRKFFKAIETGRGPRKTTQDSGFKDYMLKYMQARGIGSDLSPKKRENLAKFLVLKINKEGDQTFKNGGRVVYTPTLEKLKEEIIRATKNEIRKEYSKTIVNGFNSNG